MIINVRVERTYRMDENRVLSEPGFRPPDDSASVDEKRAWLEESFFELCGWDRDEDHVDGTFVRLTDEWGESEFRWEGSLE